MTAQRFSGPPKDYRALQQAIFANADGLSRRMQQVANYLLDHPEEVAFGSVATVAKSAKVASSAIVRFGQTLGLTGFSDLQALFQAEIAARAGGGLAGLSGRAGDSSGPLAEAAQGCLMALRRLGSMRTEDQVRVAANTLAPARTIHLVANGRSYPLGMLATAVLRDCGIRTLLATPVEADAFDVLSFVEEGDAVLEIDIGRAGPIEGRRAGEALPHVAIVDSLRAAARIRADRTVLVAAGPFASMSAMVVIRALCTALQQRRSEE